MDYFEDYVDEEGNLHIDARKPKKKVSETRNFRAKIEDIKKAQVSTGKLVIHHVDMSGTGNDGVIDKYSKVTTE